MEYKLPEPLSILVNPPSIVLASSMKLGYSINDVLPNTTHARDRLLACLHRYRKDEPKSSLSSDEDYALLYAYGM